MAVFVGRERENEVLDESLAAALAGDGQFVLVSGEAGIGKTRLAEELSDRATTRGFTTAWGRAWEGEGTPAYFPWLQILRRLKPTLGPLLDTIRVEVPELALLLEPPRSRALRTGGEAIVDPTEARFRMFDGVAELLRVASVECPLLLVLDDLHAADVSTLDLLRFVARSARKSSRLLIVGTMRDGTAPSHPLVAHLAREATPLALSRLRREAVAAWVAHAAPELSSSIDRLVSVSEGNPLFVGELLASATKQPERRWASAHELPLGVREAIRAHIHTLSDHARDVLARASVQGRDFAHDGADAAIEEAIRAGVVVSVAESEPGHHERRFRFTHVLIREELYASLLPTRRAELHREAAASERDPVVVVHHWLSGGRIEDAVTVHRTVVAAMQDALARFAFDDAALIGEQALRKLAFDPSAACELRIAIGEAWVLAGHPDTARSAGAEAAREAQRIGDAALLARAALVHATETVFGPRDAAAIDLLRAALEALGPADSPLRARIMGRLAIALLPAPPEEHDGALALAEDAIAMARRLGDEETLFTVLAFTRRTPSETDPPNVRFALNAETIGLARKLGRVPEVASLFAWQVAACIELGDIDGAAREADAMEALLGSYTQPSYRYQALLVRALLADLEGRFAEADALSQTVLQFCADHGIRAGQMLALVQRTGFMYTRAGDSAGWAEVEPLAMSLLMDDPLSGIFRCTYDAPCGRIEKVRESLDLTKDLPLDALPDGGCLAAPLALAGIVEHAARFYDFVEKDEPKRGPWSFGPGRVASMGPRALTLGRLAMLLGRTEDAVRHFERALAYVERLRARPFIAQTRLELAEALGSREHADVALQIATQIGLRTVEARARAFVDRDSSRRSAKPTAAESPLLLVRDGETWVLTHGKKRLVLKDTKGLSYLEALLSSPCREIHVLELVGRHPEGDAGPVLDERAKREYRERAEALREDLEEATCRGDAGRAERARTELEAIAHELTSAVGIGGRDRRAVSPAERARINVQRRIRDVIARVRAMDAGAGEYLQLSVRTGMFCVYLPFSRA